MNDQSSGAVKHDLPLPVKQNPTAQNAPLQQRDGTLEEAVPENNPRCLRPKAAAMTSMVINAQNTCLGIELKISRRSLAAHVRNSTFRLKAFWCRVGKRDPKEAFS
jgi:hypothetical protein